MECVETYKEEKILFNDSEFCRASWWSAETGEESDIAWYDQHSHRIENFQEHETAYQKHLENED